MSVEDASSSTPETAVRRPGRRWSARSVGAYAALFAVVAVLGGSSVEYTTVVFAAVMLVAALPLLNGRPVIWIALAITVPWTSRLLTTTGAAPRILDFLDFPLVLIAFLFAGVRFLDSGRRLTPPVRRICRYVLLATVIIALAWAFNNFDEPQRLIAGWVLALEPFLLLVAVVLAPMTVTERRRLLGLIVVLLCGQLVFSLAQIVLSGAVADEVKGTLLEAGAGHHVSAGGLAVGFFLLARQRVPKLLIGVVGALTLLVTVVADAKQVLFALPLALVVLAMSGWKRRTARSAVGGLVGGAVMAGASVFALLSYQATSAAFDFLDRASTNDTGKFAVLNALWTDIAASPHTFLFGFGPGETVSRFAFLTTPALFKEGSPVALLGLQPSTYAQTYDKIAFSGPFTGESSFTSAQSSALGILGDYGIAGLLTFAALILAVLIALLRCEDRRLRASALAAWTLLLPLALVFDWLEQPPFTLAVMLLTGLALRGPGSLDKGPSLETANKADWNQTSADD